MRPEQLRGHLDMLLLAVLSTGPAHGYAVGAELRRRSGGDLAVLEGSLYPALHRLEAAGLVTSTRETISGRRRRSYEITASGKTAFDDARADWEQFKHSIDAILEATP